MTILATARVVHDRTVWTYQPDTWPLGCITGYNDNHGGFVIEHVMAFGSNAMRPMMLEGLEVAQAAGYAYLVFGLPLSFPLAVPLLRLAGSVGFEEYAEVGEWVYCVRYL